MKYFYITARNLSHHIENLSSVVCLTIKSGDLPYWETLLKKWGCKRLGDFILISCHRVTRTGGRIKKMICLVCGEVWKIERLTLENRKNVSSIGQLKRGIAEGY